MEMTCEGCSNAAKRVLAKIGGMCITFMSMVFLPIICIYYYYYYTHLMTCFPGQHV